MWHTHCSNPEALERLYADPSGLDEVTMVEATLDNQRHLLRLRVELPRFPDRPPSRWDPGANAVQATLDGWLASLPGGTARIQLHGWAPAHRGLLGIQPSPEGVLVTFQGPTLELSARCSLVRIGRISAYTDEPNHDEEIP